MAQRGSFLGGIIGDVKQIGKTFTKPITDVVGSDAFKTTEASSSEPILRGLFGQIGHELNQFGKTISREADSAAKQIDKALATNASGSVLNLFQPNNVIQLVSKTSNRTLQIVQNPNGQLIVDGLGGAGPSAFNAVWTVINEGSNQVRLHNNNNYLAIENGCTIVRNVPPGAMHGLSTKFQLIQLFGQFVVLESLAERKRHIGIMPDGQLKSAVATGREDHAQFGVQLIYSPYGAGAVKH